MTPADTIGRFIYELGNRQLDIPEFRALLEEILPQSHTIEDYLVEGDFAHLGRRSMLLNARRSTGDLTVWTERQRRSSQGCLLAASKSPANVGSRGPAGAPG